MRQEITLFSFNRGVISPLAFARTDQRRVAMSADTMTNWMPRILGPMSLRPGWQYLLSTLSNAEARYLPFVFSNSDTALLELTNQTLRPLVSEAVITRPSVTAAVTNGTFDSDITGWTDNDEVGGASAWQTGGYMGLTGNGTAAAIRDQQVTVNETSTEHALRIVIERGPVVLRVGSNSGDDDYISETTLETGTHSLAFTPTGDFHIRFLSRLKRIVLVDSCTVESAGAVTLPTPWLTADLENIRYDQSADVIFNACTGYQQRRIERRATRSWSVVRYAPEDGPFRVENLGPITISSSAISGNVTLTASAALFKSDHVGTLFRITSTGQTVTASITAENTFTNAIRITGVEADRIFTIQAIGSFTATVTLQRSLDSESGPWTDVETYTTSTIKTLDDSLDNQIAWYRIGVKTGDYTSGTVTATLTISSGSITGIARITAYTSGTSVSAEIITDLGGTAATDEWTEGKWSDLRGYPTAVVFHEGRLWWAGKDSIIGSVSDAFESFDPDTIGDSAPINRAIGSGPVDTISWLVSLKRLIVGGQGAEFNVRSSALDEPISTETFNIKDFSTQGSLNLQAIKIDSNCVFVQRGGARIYEVSYQGDSYEYSSADMTAVVPEMALPGVARITVQRQPDTRIHVVRTDGTVMLGVFDRSEDVLAWIDITTDGSVEDVVVLPGDEEDSVYYVVDRTVNGSTVRYLEKWAKETECRGGTLNKQADSFIEFTNSPASSTVAGLSHLEAEEVVVWADGKCLTDANGDIATFTVSSGQISLTNVGSAYSASTGIVGKTYTAQWESSKLAQQPSQVVAALSKEKKIDHIGLVMAWVHAKGLKYGPDFSTLDELPEIEQGVAIDHDAVRTTYEESSIEFPGRWLTDARLCLQAQAPRPCTILAAIPNMRVVL